MWELGVVVGQGCSGGREGRYEVLKGRTIWVARDGGETGEGGGVCWSWSCRNAVVGWRACVMRSMFPCGCVTCVGGRKLSVYQEGLRWGSVKGFGG